ncbi:MAG TPA: bifunctional nuclease family protein [Saprospiraceae bacterium]|nr:bifunctional nuclease family protein [Saprospiraceae bacterium]HMQ81808.1 bifunctional nuclease family protein [Saprospiraceae bacterium]
MKKVELHIIALAESESSPGNYALILEEQVGGRRLPILVGPFEAQSIAISLERMQPNRPLTHDLFKNTLKLLGVSLTEVIISDLVEGVFHATLIGKKEDQSMLSIDARSSDAIALAVRFDCPIFTTEAILEKAGFLLDSPSKAFISKRGQLSDYSLEELEHMLQQVVAKEDYESAAKIREAIRKKKGG